MSWFKFGFGKKKQKDETSSETPALDAPEAEMASEAPVESAVIAEIEKDPDSLDDPRPAPVDPEPELVDRAETVAEDNSPNPDEIAGYLSYLCSDNMSQITGQVLHLESRLF